MICVYDAACTDFSNNGLGPINPTSCQVTETLNGEYELTLIHPIDEIGKWQRLVEGNIVRAPVPAAMTPQINPQGGLLRVNYRNPVQHIIIIVAALGFGIVAYFQYVRRTGK